MPSSVHHRKQVPTGPAPLPLMLTCGASSEQVLARRWRTAATLRESEPHPQPRRLVVVPHAADARCPGFRVCLLLPAYYESMDDR